MSVNVQYKRKCNKYEKKIQDLLKNELDEYEEIEVIDEKEEKSWVEISNNVRKSIVQIFVSSHTIDPMKPYIYPPDKLVRGSGFVIHNDNNKILIMTMLCSKNR